MKWCFSAPERCVCITSAYTDHLDSSPANFFDGIGTMGNIHIITNTNWLSSCPYRLNKPHEVITVSKSWQLGSLALWEWRWPACAWVEYLFRLTMQLWILWYYRPSPLFWKLTAIVFRNSLGLTAFFIELWWDSNGFLQPTVFSVRGLLQCGWGSILRTNKHTP